MRLGHGNSLCSLPMFTLNCLDARVFITGLDANTGIFETENVRIAICPERLYKRCSIHFQNFSRVVIVTMVYSGVVWRDWISLSFREPCDTLICFSSNFSILLFKVIVRDTVRYPNKILASFHCRLCDSTCL